MRWRKGRRSSNVEDRRGQGAGGGLPGGLFPGMGRGRVRVRSGGGLVTLVVILGVMYFLGVDPAILLQNVGTGVPGTTGGSQPRSPEEDQLADFSAVVLADTEDTWNAIFQASGEQYREPTLVLFTGSVKSACGHARAATGPFYCPPDQKLYIDLSFYEELKRRHGAPGDFAQAYVIAHEVGHHVQNLLGTSTKVQSMRRRLGGEEGNRLSVRLELQADCYAGVWGNHADRARQILEEGDVEEALTAATAIGDDRLQRESRGYVTPESFTHGTSAQRVKWFRRGLASGDTGDCDTFGMDDV
jgi:predicted metalloprotease